MSRVCGRSGDARLLYGIWTENINSEPRICLEQGVKHSSHSEYPLTAVSHPVSTIAQPAQCLATLLLHIASALPLETLELENQDLAINSL